MLQDGAAEACGTETGSREVPHPAGVPSGSTGRASHHPRSYGRQHPSHPRHFRCIRPLLAHLGQPIASMEAQTHGRQAPRPCVWASSRPRFSTSPGHETGPRSTHQRREAMAGADPHKPASRSRFATRHGRSASLRVSLPTTELRAMLALTGIFCIRRPMTSGARCG